MRILALGFKMITEEEFAKKQQPRDFVESSLTFAGFIAFTRTDSLRVIRSVMEYDHAEAEVIREMQKRKRGISS